MKNKQAYNKGNKNPQPRVSHIDLSNASESQGHQQEGSFGVSEIHVETHFQDESNVNSTNVRPTSPLKPIE